MMRHARYAWRALLLAAFVAAVLWVLPARWAMAWIPDSSPIVLTNASGTLWNAHASVAVGVGGLRRGLPDPVHWRLAFDGGPTLIVRHPWLQGPLTIAPSWRGMRVSAQTLQLPATVLPAFHAVFNTLDAGGDVHLAWPELVVGREVHSDGKDLLNVHWRNASSSLSRVRPMGDYTLVLTPGSNHDMGLSLSTARGPLVLEGAGTLTRTGARLDGKAYVQSSAPADIEAGLRNLLAAMGPRSGPDGSTLLTIR